MKINLILSFLMVSVLSAMNLTAQTLKESEHSSTSQTKADTTLTKPQKSVTNGMVTVEGTRIDYQAVAGTLVLKNKKDEPTCSMFYVAYFKSNESNPAKRPVTFIYNGGPGSASVWLHLGAWGPKRVNAADTAQNVAPYSLVNNDYSLLDASDLVFIDAPGTGYSQLIDKDKGGAGDPKDFYGIDQDGNAFASFIAQFLTTFNRWNSPKYLFGESYGTFRSAVVAYYLNQNHGIDLNGVIMLSQILNYDNVSGMADLNPGNEIAHQLVLPSMTATAWYHKKLPNQPEKLEPLLRKVENFALGDYALALNKGAAIDSVTFNQTAEKLHEYTGLPVDYIKKANLRVTGPGFEKTLLAGENKVTGRLDTRFSGYMVDPLSKRPSFDPLNTTISSIFIATANTYLHSTLKFRENIPYQPFGDGIGRKWDSRHQAPGSGRKIFPNVMPDLARAMIYNPKMKVMLNMGYFDLATPYFEGVYEMRHLPMPVALQKNISYDYYMSGHMVYLHLPSLKELHDKTAKFIQETH